MPFYSMVSDWLLDAVLSVRTFAVPASSSDVGLILRHRVYVWGNLNNAFSFSSIYFLYRFLFIQFFPGIHEHHPTLLHTVYSSSLPCGFGKCEGEI